MENYRCKICGKKHRVFRGIESPIPAVLREIPDDERDRRILENDSFYVLDKMHVILPGYIQVFHQSDTSASFFNWHVWVSVDARNFMSKIPLLQNNENVVISGRLESEMFFYQDVIGLDIELLIDPKASFPVIKVVNEGELKKDQQSPITTERVEELMSRLHHQEIYAPPEQYDTPFVTRLMEELKGCESKYKKGNFILNVSSPGEVIFQILPERLLEDSKGKRSGYGLHVAFDFEDEVSVEQFDRLKNLKEAENWKFCEVEGVPIYQLAVGKDVDGLCKVSVQLLKEVFQVDRSQVVIDSFEI